MQPITQHLELVLALERKDNATSGFGKFVGPRHPLWNEPVEDSETYIARKSAERMVRKAREFRIATLGADIPWPKPGKRKLRRMRAKK